jgi:very-long-chain (3R)-3-hydroxyacyl-CoA dehydratase
MDARDTSRKGQAKPLKPLQSSSPKTQYLILYNTVSCLLWLVVLLRTLSITFIAGPSHLLAEVGTFVKWTQTLAGLEVLHSLTGVVRAPVITTAMQVASRYLLVWGIVDVFGTQVVSGWGELVYGSMLVAWSVTEVVRYGFFGLGLAGLLPKWLEWARYNLFYILYPLGIGSECGLMVRALGPADTWWREYKWFIWLVLGVYVPGSYVLYTHMMAQRGKVMKGKQIKKQ